MLLLSFIFFRFCNLFFSRPFSFKMRLILYFQARKFSRPSNLSSSLVLGAILTSKSLKNQIYQNRRLNLLVYALGGGELVDPTAFWRSLIFILQILLARLHHCSFMVPCQTRVWISWRSNHPKNLI